MKKLSVILSIALMLALFISFACKPNLSDDDHDSAPVEDDDDDMIDDDDMVDDDDTIDDDDDTCLGNEPPTALFTLNYHHADTGTTFSVDASISTDNEDSTADLEVRWRWGDGSPWSTWKTAKDAANVYGAQGTYQIELEVKDTCGETGSANDEVHVWATPESEFVDGEGAQDMIMPNISLESGSIAHLSYFDFDTGGNYEGDYWYAVNTSKGWSTENIYSAENNPYGRNNIVVDAAGIPHVIVTNSGTVLYNTTQFGVWQSWERLDYGGGSWGAIAPTIGVDAIHKIHASYSSLDGGKTDINTGWYATNNTGSWVNTEVLDFYYPDIAIDENGKVHLCFEKHQNGIWYAHNKSGSWTSGELVYDAPGRERCSIKVDSQGVPHIAIIESKYSYLYYKYYTGSQWEEETVQAGDAQGTPSLSLDGDSSIHITYYDNSSSSIKYATNIHGTWSFADLQEGSSSFDSEIGSDDMMHVTYVGSGSIYYMQFPQGYAFIE